MVKRRIEQNLRIKNFEARSGNFEKNAVVKNQGTKQREQRSLGYCWQWKTCFGCLLIKYTTIGLRVPGYGAAEVFIDFAEEL